VVLNVVDAQDPNEVPVALQLKQNFPNPFNPNTTISFSCTEIPDNSELIIYNLKGQVVRSFHYFTNLFETENMGDLRSVIWNGTNNNGESVPSGIYLYKLKLGQQIQTRKMILMK